MHSIGQVTLAFGRRGRSVLADLSAGARIGDTFFCASDETTAIEVLTADGDRWTLRETHFLEDMMHLPSGPDDEVDIESLAIHDGWLWLTGSHSLVRPDVADDGPRKGLRRLGEIQRQANRFVLARMPLVERRTGQFAPVAEAGRRRARMVEAGKRSSALIKWIEEDALLAPYLRLPTKENGFDIEGLAVCDDAVWLGLRGPVVRGFAVILQFKLRGTTRGALKARKLEGGRRFRKYLLPLGGLGVRDLATDGDDLLIMAGPTMMADGPSRLVRWPGALAASDSMILRPEELSVVGDFASTTGADKPEAVLLWGQAQALILHDNPAPSRIDPDAGLYRADLVALV